MVRRRGPHTNLAVLVGHSGGAHRGDGRGRLGDAQAADGGRDGRGEAPRRRGDEPGRDRPGGTLIPPNHSGWGGIPMPSTISDIGEFDARVGAMGGPGSRRRRDRLGRRGPGRDDLPGSPAGNGRRIFMTTGLVLLQRTAPRARASACSRRAPRRRSCGQGGPSPVHLPAAVVRFHAGGRLSVLQPPGLRPDQGL